MIENLINTLLQGVLNLVMFLINILLAPIDQIIAYYIPTLDDAFSLINSYIDKLIEYSGFVVSYSGLTTTTINIIIVLLVFYYTVPLMIHGIKLSIKWFKTLRG